MLHTQKIAAWTASLSLFLPTVGCLAEREGDALGECADGADNDADDHVDCDDQDCFGAKACEISSLTTEDTGTPDTDSGSPTPGSQLPEATIDAPQPLALFFLGDPVSLEGWVGDLQQPPDTLLVQWRFLDDTTGSLIEFLNVIPDDAGQVSSEWVTTASGLLRIELFVYDSDGNEATDQVQILVEMDLDGDGYTAGNEDCDDNDPAVHIGAEELCDGTIDHDCNGVIDDRDIDADGHIDEACTYYSGPDPRDDCDDANSLIHPGAIELCDGSDEDCSGTVDDNPVDGVMVYSDTDGDGWGYGTPYAVCGVGTGEVEVGGDCEDLDAEVNPGATEICGTGRDEDCDSFHAPCVFEGTLMSSHFAAKLDSPSIMTDVDIGDFNGDGVREVVAASGYAISNNGRVHVAEPPTGTLSLDSSALDLELTGRWLDEGFGDAVSVADVDLDGDDDLLVGATFGGASSSWLGGAYLFRGPLVSGTYSDAAYLQIYGLASLDQFGHDVAFIEDQTGDGLPDLLIGARGADPSGVFSAGEAYVFDGTSSGILSSADAVSTLRGATGSAQAGTRVLDAGDVDGDGQTDLLIGADGLQAGGVFAGGAYLVHGPAPALLDLDLDSDARLEGTELSYAGRALAAEDLDGDGYSDVVVGAPNYGNTSSLLEGLACVLPGPLPPVAALVSGSLCVYGGSAGEHTGGVLALGDLNQDGQLDLVVDFQYGSVLRAFDGALTGTVGSADAFLIIEADTYGDDLLPVIDDLDGDDIDDIVLIAQTDVWIALTTAF